MNENAKLSKKTLAIICSIVILLLGIPLSIRHKQVNMIEKIYNAYEDNANQAIKKYDGKKITVIGAVEKISDSGTEMTIIPLKYKKDGYTLDNAICKTNDEKNQKRVSKLKKGKTVKVKGTVHVEPVLGNLYNIEIDVDSIS